MSPTSPSPQTRAARLCSRPPADGSTGADGSRIALAGNSVGGNMTAALTLMDKDRNGPKISYQILFVPATDANVDTESYREFGIGAFWPATS
jgi:acetyl esterase/lipase